MIKEISLTGDITGTSVFNAETGKAEIDTKRKGCVVGNVNAGAVGVYCKVASIKALTNYNDRNITFKVSGLYANAAARETGILRAYFRTYPGGFSDFGLVWEYAVSGIDLNNYVMIGKVENGTVFAEIYCKTTSNYSTTSFEVISEGDRGIRKNWWVLYDLPTPIETLPEDYTVVTTSALAAIQNPVRDVMGMKYFDTGGTYAFSFRFSIFYEGMNTKARVPILIVVGSQSDNQTSMIPITLYSNGSIGRPANSSSEIGTITAEDGLVTINTDFNNRWSIFLVLYPPALVDITNA